MSAPVRRGNHWMRDDVTEVLQQTYRAVAKALARLASWDDRGARDDQYACDIVADEAACEVLDAAGFGIVSEERAAQGLDREIVVVVDPVDGTANAIRGIPYFATSLCAIDSDGLRAALVVNLATGTQFEAVRGGGARCDGTPLRTSSCTALSDATVAVCGMPGQQRPWRHLRAFGATALELCDVARGALDAYINTDDDLVAPWDYLGGLLVCSEAGAAAGEARGRPLLTLEPGQRRIPLVAATPQLLADIIRDVWPSAPAAG